MFKPESYVTPIILNHIAKYVKDIKPEDAQVSLWEGEVNFQNLELRLDVLEDELNLPIELKTGHIHDLSVQVPWTRINSEPVKIIINTIEFVVKLRKDDGAPMPRRQKVEVKRESLSNQQQPSRIVGLVNKIINNIHVEFQNIIFKFLDEDFVVSMNIQSLILTAANDSWQPAMVDINPVKVILRKLVQLKDLTICLDQLNEAGEIDVSHEPILYRCNLECRFLKKYHVNTAKTSSITRVGVLMKSLNLLISSLQFPLAMKILDLVTDISKGNVKIKKVYEEETVEGAEVAENNGSYLSWAWNLIPSLTFNYANKEELDENAHEGHELDIGLYLDVFNLTFKNSEYVHDAIVGGIKRIRYQPIVKVNFGGFYCEVQTNEVRNWFAAKSGVSKFCIEPLGIYRSEKTCVNILEGNIEAKNCFTDMSLFDTSKELSDKYWMFSCLDEYNKRISDKYLLSRSPIFAFDIVYSNENIDDVHQVIPAFESESNRGTPKQVQMRLLSSGMTLRFNQHLQQVNHIITDLLNTYKLSAYHSDKLDAVSSPYISNDNSSTNTTSIYSISNSNSNSSAMTPDDIDAIVNILPKTNYIVQIENLTVEFYAQTEPLFDKSKGSWMPNQQSILTLCEKEKIPFFCFHFNIVKGKCTKLTDTSYLSQKFSQYKEPSLSLLGAYYKNFDFTFADTTLRLQYPGESKGAKLAFVPQFEVNYSRLTQPYFWKDEETAFSKVFIKCPYLKMSFSKRQFVQCYRLYSHIGTYNPNTLSAYSKQDQQDYLMKDQQQYLKINFNDLNLTKIIFEEHALWYLSLKSISGVLWNDNSSEKRHIFNSINDSDEIQWLEAQFQNPFTGETKEVNKLKLNYAIGLWIRDYQMIIDESVLEFLKYRDEFEYVPEEDVIKENEVKVTHFQQPASSITSTHTYGTASNCSLSQQHCSSTNRRFNRAHSSSRKQSFPEESVHYSSERDEVVREESQCQKTESIDSMTTPDGTAKYINFLNILQRSVFNIELGSWKINVGDRINIRKDCKQVGNYAQLSFKKIFAKSDTHYLILCGDLTKKITYVHPEKNDFNVFISFEQFSLRYKDLNTTETIFENLTFTFSIFLEYKLIKFPVFFADQVSPTPSQPTEVVIPIDVEEEADEEDSSNEEEELVSKIFKIDPEPPSLPPPNKDEKITDTHKSFKLTDAFPRDTMYYKPARRKSKTRHELSINVHLNITNINLFIKKLKELQHCMELVYRFHESLSCDPLESRKANKIMSESVQIVTANEKSSILDEFLQMDLHFNMAHCASNDSSLKVAENFHHRLKMSLFGQCSIEKVAIVVDNCSVNPTAKMVFSIEDILSTLDTQHHYFKFTAKFGNCGMDLIPYKTEDNSDFYKAVHLKMINNETDSLSVANIVYTVVDTDTLHDKLMIKIKNPKMKKEGSIREAIITLHEIELMLHLDVLQKFLQPSSPIYDLLDLKQQTKANATKASNSSCVSELPLLYFDCQGVSCYFITKTPDIIYDLALYKMEHVKITPHLKNPLERNPIRPDVYRKASLLGIVNFPGSIIENRQYEISLLNMSAFTGIWMDMKHYVSSASKSSNPALEWNNEVQDHNNCPLKKLFSGFSIICTYAPAITYKHILICGEAIEINCVNDFIAHLNTSQLKLIGQILNKLKHIQNISSTNPKPTSNLKNGSSLTFASAINCSIETCNKQSHKNNKTLLAPTLGTKSDNTIYEDCLDNIPAPSQIDGKSDSGYSSKQPRQVNSQLSVIRKISKDSSANIQQAVRKVPYSFSLVAGKFIFHFFRLKNPPNDKAEATEKPLISIGFSEPSFMLKQNVFDNSFQISLFDLVLSIANLQTNELNEDILVTFPGKPNISGIPSPLFNYKSTVTKQKLCETEIEIGKSIVFNHYEAHMKRLFDNFLVLHNALTNSSMSIERAIRPILKGSKIKLLKERFLNADRLHVVCQRLEVNFSDQHNYKCRFVAVDAYANTKFFPCPEKASIKAGVGSFSLQTSNQIFVHPVKLKMSATFLREPWNHLPLVLATLKFNVMHVDLSVDLLKQFQEALRSIQVVLGYYNTKYELYLKAREHLKEDPTTKSKLQQLKASKIVNMKEKRLSRLNTKEFYQDDLRAGAFQFVEVFSDNILPSPYQIQIINKDFGIVCWRYPHPRKMYKIQVFPVPMQTEKAVQIKCRMEYYSDLFNRFMYYCDFALTQNVTTDVILPDHEVCATIWRVVILQCLVAVNSECFKLDEDEELKSIPSYSFDESFNYIQNERDISLNPKILVGCLQIDTTFQPKHIPKVQVLISCNVILAKLLHESHGQEQIPKELKRLKAKNMTNAYQNMLEISLEKFDFCTTFFNKEFYTLDSCLTATIKTLDVGYLNMLPMLEPTKVQFYAAINKETRNSIANLIVDKLSLNVGPSVLQTLVRVKKHVQCFLSASESVTESFTSKCIIVNHTDIEIMFGQTGTNEKITLAPDSYHFYYFSNEKLTQKLTFSIVVESKKGSKVLSNSLLIPLKFDGDIMYNCLQVGDACLNIRIKKLSTGQVLINVRGQVELISMLSHDLLAQFRCGNDHETKYRKDSVIFQKSSNSFFMCVQQESNLNLRLRFIDVAGKSRTGDIPLKVTKNLPWLVKIPVQDQNFISVWIRVLREDVACIPDANSVAFLPQKILIIIWPVFQVENFLTSPIQITDVSTETTTKVDGRRSIKALDIAATNVSEHNMEIDYNKSVAASEQKSYTLMLKALDWHQLFQYNEDDWTIEKTIQILSQDEILEWPLNHPEELEIKRFSRRNTSAKVSLKCNLSNEFACSMSLVVKPWGLFINATGVDVGIRSVTDNNRQQVTSNYIEMMSSIDKAFTIDVQRGSDWYSSSTINYLDILKQHASLKDKSKSSKSFNLDLTIVLEDVVVCFVLNYAYENEICIFKLSSKYIVTNYLGENLCLLPFAMSPRETITREELLPFDRKVPKFHIKPSNSTTKIGVTLDAFFDIKSHVSRRSKEPTFLYFVSLKRYDNSELSIPIPLSSSFPRRCISVQSQSDSIPIIISLLEKDSIFYLNISRDVSPTFLLFNRTDVPLIVAQTTASENSQVTNTTAEYEGRHFDWFHVIPPLTKSYYTPPSLSSGFSTSDTALCNISLALFKDNFNKKTIKWSKPIRTDKTWQKSLHLTGHGDIKVLICDKHSITRISIFYVSEQSEFSVKDLRSRIITRNLQPETSLPSIKIDSEFSIETSEKRPVSSKDEPSLQKVLHDIECEHFRNEVDLKCRWKLKLYSKELRLTLHTEDKVRDSFKQEIISLHIDDMAVAFEENKDERNVNILMSNVQVDNQMYRLNKYDFPVILCAQTLYDRKSKVTHIHDLKKVYQQLSAQQPMFDFTLKLYSDEFVLNSIYCKISPLRVYIEDSFVNDFLEALLDFSQVNTITIESASSKQQLELAPGESLVPETIVSQVICIAEPMKLRHFVIDSLEVLLSVHTSVRLYIALDHSPLSFAKYERQNVLTMPIRFGQSLGLHYLSGAIFGAGWVVGSLEILGSPSGLARSVTTGIKDFVSMPVEGLFRGPWGFLVGITQGSASLFRNVTAGTVNSVTKLAASIARNLDRLSLDKEHIERTDALRRARPQGLTQGLSQGLTGFGISLLGAVGGIAHHSLEANSAVGVITGLSKGIVGAFTKPLSGAAELVALTGQGMLHTVGFNAMPQPVSSYAGNILTTEPSSYRVWKLLPNELLSDQILIYNEVTLAQRGHMKKAYVFLTTSIFAIVDAGWEKLELALPLNKVDIHTDPVDKTLLYVKTIKEPQDDIEERHNFTNERILNFLQQSEHSLAPTSLQEIFRFHQENSFVQSDDWAFFIDVHFGEHLIQYINIMKINNVNL